MWALKIHWEIPVQHQMPDKVSHVVEPLATEEMDIFSGVSGGDARDKSALILDLHSSGGQTHEPK